MFSLQKLHVETSAGNTAVRNQDIFSLPFWNPQSSGGGWCWVSNYTCLEQRGGPLRKEATGYGSVKAELAVQVGQRRLPWEEASPKAAFKWDASHGEGECKSPPCRERLCAVPAHLGWQRRGPVCVRQDEGRGQPRHTCPDSWELGSSTATVIVGILVFFQCI